MAWLVLVAMGVVVLVAVTVLPRRGRLGRAPGFPWFWVVLPVTCIAVAATLGVFFRPEIVTHASSIWWGRPGTGSPRAWFAAGAIPFGRAVPALHDAAADAIDPARRIRRRNRPGRRGMAAPPDMTGSVRLLAPACTRSLASPAKMRGELETGAGAGSQESLRRTDSSTRSSTAERFSAPCPDAMRAMSPSRTRSR